MKKLLGLVFVASMLSGCAVGEWLAAQDFDVCVEYKGRHVCVGRKDGKWVFGVDAEEGPALSAEDEADIMKGLGR